MTVKRVDWRKDYAQKQVEEANAANVQNGTSGKGSSCFWKILGVLLLVGCLAAGIAAVVMFMPDK